MSNHLNDLNTIVEKLRKSMEQNEKFFNDAVSKIEDKSIAISLQNDLQKLKVNTMKGEGFQKDLDSIIDKINKAGNDNK